MSDVRKKKWLVLFCAIVILVLTQIAWWVTLFMRDTDLIERLKVQNLELQVRSDPVPLPIAIEPIRQAAFRRRIMFWSESIFFGFLTCVGLYMLYHALRMQSEAARLQREFVTTVSHESKTPLTALKLRLESAREKAQENPTLRQETNLALEEVRRLSTIFDNMLNLNRLERQGIQFEPTYLSEIVDSLCRRMEPLIQTKNVKVETNLDPAIVVNGDPYGLQSCVQTLMENAIRYNTNENKELRVSVSGAAKGLAVVSVADNGPGIESTDRPHLFEKFYRGKNGRLAPGTGLGLYIAKTIVKAHRGDIEFRPGANSGSVFEIRIPRMENS